MASCMRLPSWGLSGAGLSQLSALRALFPIPRHSIGWTKTVTPFCWNSHFLIETPAENRPSNGQIIECCDIFEVTQLVSCSFLLATSAAQGTDSFSSFHFHYPEGSKGAWQPLFQQPPKHTCCPVAKAGYIHLPFPTWELKVLRRLSCDSLSLSYSW